MIWIKLYAEKWLNGSIRLAEPVARAVFIDLLCLASKHDGLVQVIDGVPYTEEQLSSIVGVSKKELKDILLLLEETGRIKVRKNGIISIKNWSKYQVNLRDGKKDTGVIFDMQAGKLIVDAKVRKDFCDRLNITEEEFEYLKKDAEDYLVMSGRRYRDYRRFLWNNMRMLKWKLKKRQGRKEIKGKKFKEGVEI